MPLGGCAVRAPFGAVEAVGLAAAQDKNSGRSVDDTTRPAKSRRNCCSESINRRLGEVDVK